MGGRWAALALVVVAGCADDGDTGEADTAASSGSGGSSTTGTGAGPSTVASTGSSTTTASSSTTITGQGGSQGGGGQGGSGEGGAGTGGSGTGGGGNLTPCTEVAPFPAVVCPGGACEVVFDTALDCDDPFLADGGVDLAVAGARTFFVTNGTVDEPDGYTSADLFEIVDGAIQRVAGFQPADASWGRYGAFLAVDSGGVLYAAAEETTAIERVPASVVLVHGTPEDGFTRTTVQAPLEEEDAYPIALELGGDVLNVWYSAAPGDLRRSVLLPEGDLATEEAPTPQGYGNHGFVATPDPISFAPTEVESGLQLQALDDAGLTLLGTPYDNTDYAGLYRVVPPPSDLPDNPGPPYAVVLQDAAGVRLLQPGAEQLVPGHAPPVRNCPGFSIVPEGESCPAPCHEDAEGVIQFGAAADLTASGDVILAAVHVRYDFDVIYEPFRDGSVVQCPPIELDDATTAELVVIRRSATTGDLEELLRSPFTPLDTYGFGNNHLRDALDVEVSGADLVIAARVRPGLPVVRVVRLTFPEPLERGVRD